MGRLPGDHPMHQDSSDAGAGEHYKQLNQGARASGEGGVHATDWRDGTEHGLCARAGAAHAKQRGDMKVGKKTRAERGAALRGCESTPQRTRLCRTRHEAHMVRHAVGLRRGSGGADPGCIPNTGSGGVELDVRMGKQVLLKALQQECSVTGLMCRRERADTPVGDEVGVHIARRAGPRCEKGRHERITLVRNTLPAACFGSKLGWRAVEKPYKWQDGIGIRRVAEGCQHDMPAYYVEGPTPSTDSTVSDQPPEQSTNDDAPNASCRFA